MDIGSRVKFDNFYGWIVGLSVGTKQPIVRFDNGTKLEFMWSLLEQVKE